MPGSSPPGPVTADDVTTAVDLAVAALRPVIDRDWRVTAGGLDWDCWETLEHVADDLFAYAGQLGPGRPPLEKYVPIFTRTRRPGGPNSAIFADPAAGTAGLLWVLETCAAFLSALVRTTPAEVRAYHPFGISDPEGFAAMGIVEVLVHLNDVAIGLDFVWAPPADLCDRVLVRLFPAAPADTERWPTLLWATGRGEIPGRERLSSWQWDSENRSAGR